MNTPDTDMPRDERNERDDQDTREEPTPARTGSRDLDAIAARLAAARSGGAEQASPRADTSNDGAAARDGARARDAARIRSLIDRPAASADFVASARGYASELPELDAHAVATHREAHAETSPAPDPTAAAGPATISFPRQDELDDLAKPMPAPRRRRFARGVATTVTVGVGLVIALGAYAGGGEYIAELIDRDESSIPVQAPVEYADPVVIDSTLSAADSIAEAEQLATFGELPNDTIRRAPFGSGRIAPITQATRPKLGDTLRPRIVAVDAESSRAKNEKRPEQTSTSRADSLAKTKEKLASALRAKEAATKKPSSTDSARAKRPETPAAKAATKSSGSYSVQVRATPDRTEADRLAARLKARGSRNVSVTTSTKNGQTVYRVRYGAFTDEKEARRTAARDGHSDAWVVRR